LASEMRRGMFDHQLDQCRRQISHTTSAPVSRFSDFLVALEFRQFVQPATALATAPVQKRHQEVEVALAGRRRPGLHSVVNELVPFLIRDVGEKAKAEDSGDILNLRLIDWADRLVRPVQEPFGRNGDRNAWMLAVDDVVSELTLGFEADRFSGVAVFRRRDESSTLADAAATSAGANGPAKMPAAVALDDAQPRACFPAPPRLILSAAITACLNC
jgi:hypothetical protein